MHTGVDHGRRLFLCHNMDVTGDSSWAVGTHSDTSDSEIDPMFLHDENLSHDDRSPRSTPGKKVKLERPLSLSSSSSYYTNSSAQVQRISTSSKFKEKQLYIKVTFVRSDSTRRTVNLDPMVNTVLLDADALQQAEQNSTAASNQVDADDLPLSPSGSSTSFGSYSSVLSTATATTSISLAVFKKTIAIMIKTGKFTVKGYTRVRLYRQLSFFQ